MSRGFWDFFSTPQFCRSARRNWRAQLPRDFPDESLGKAISVRHPRWVVLAENGIPAVLDGRHVQAEHYHYRDRVRGREGMLWLHEFAGPRALLPRGAALRYCTGQGTG